jgi:RNA recognition motif-containing protein
MFNNANGQFNTLYLSNLGIKDRPDCSGTMQITFQHIIKKFCRFGPIKEIRLPDNLPGCAFIEYINCQDASEAVSTIGKTVIIDTCLVNLSPSFSRFQKVGHVTHQHKASQYAELLNTKFLIDTEFLIHY